MHSSDAELFSYMLIEFHINYGFPSEYDLFLTQSVLQYLCLRNIKAANQLFISYTNNHPSLVNEFKSKTKTDNKIYESSLLNFTNFLMQTIKM